MKSLDELRINIDEIDRQLVELFEKRMNIVAEIAKYKEKNCMPILDAERENTVILKNISRLKNTSLKPEAEEFFKYLMDISRRYQAKKIKLPSDIDDKK